MLLSLTKNEKKDPFKEKKVYTVTQDPELQ